jgi:hypothetical protein
MARLLWATPYPFIHSLVQLSLLIHLCGRFSHRCSSWTCSKNLASFKIGQVSHFPNLSRGLSLITISNTLTRALQCKYIEEHSAANTNHIPLFLSISITLSASCIYVTIAPYKRHTVFIKIHISQKALWLDFTWMWPHPSVYILSVY